MEYVEVGKRYRSKFQSGREMIDCIFQIESIITDSRYYSSKYDVDKPIFTIKILKTNYVCPGLMDAVACDSILMQNAVPYSWSESVIEREVDDFVKE